MKKILVMLAVLMCLAGCQNQTPEPDDKPVYSLSGIEKIWPALSSVESWSDSEDKAYVRFYSEDGKYYYAEGRWFSDDPEKVAQVLDYKSSGNVRTLKVSFSSNEEDKTIELEVPDTFSEVISVTTLLKGRKEQFAADTGAGVNVEEIKNRIVGVWCDNEAEFYFDFYVNDELYDVIVSSDEKQESYKYKDFYYIGHYRYVAELVADDGSEMIIHFKIVIPDEGSLQEMEIEERTYYRMFS